MKTFAKIFLPLILSLCCFGLSACGETPETPAELPAPEELQITDDVLYWNAAEGAEDYGVYIDGVEHITAECSYDLSREDSSCVHKIEVVAYGKNGAACSRGETIEYVGRNAPPTEGLEFSVQASANRCFVTKVSVDENGVCILPETYNGARVEGLSTSLVEGASQVKVLYLSRNIDEHSFGGGVNIFRKLTALERIYTAERDDQFVGAGGGIIDSSENKLIVAGMKTVIPDYVTKIGDYAYAGRALKSFVVPERIVEIGRYGLFYDCTQLEYVTLPERVAEGSKWGGMFHGCSSLKEIRIPNGIVEMDVTFANCTSLTEATVPDGVTSITGVFGGCTSLVSVSLPQSIEKINWAFRACTSLQSIEIPKNVQSLDLAFGACTSLESVTVPGSVKEVSGTFAACISLKSVVLEEGVEILAPMKMPLIGTYYAFQQCIALTDISLPSTLTTIGERSFEGCISLKSIMIPESTAIIRESAFVGCPLYNVFYKGTEAEWNEKLNINETGNETLLSATRYYYSETEPTEAGNFWHYVDGKPTKWAE